ncbi:hypothetical protein [Tangfeifania diversioriginum]|nr:hypothetical protein [Tangfeifania diversioriginum]
MKITRSNYEPYFLDYLEGNLDENLVDEFLEFLKENPDLKEELSMMDTAPLDADAIFFSKKEKLYKNKFDSEKEFNRAAVALVEGDLSDSEKEEFDNYLLKHPEKQKEIELFQHTKLQPDKTVVFAHKNKLYRRSPGRTIYMWSLRVAAVFVVALAFYTLFNQTDFSISENRVAVVESPEGSEVPVKKGNNSAGAETYDIQPIEEIKAIPADRKNEVKPKATPTLREPVQENSNMETIEEIRTPVEIPPKLNSRDAALQARQQPEVTLAAMTITLPKNYQVIEEERFLADVVKEKTGLDNFSFNKIKLAGLNLISSISKDNFDYETNEEGKVTELSYDSRLLAFSIPTNNEPVVTE